MTQLIWVLKHEQSGKPAMLGDTVTTFRGDTGEITAMREPAVKGHSGHVTVQLTNGLQREFYASVVACVWEEIPIFKGA